MTRGPRRILKQTRGMTQVTIEMREACAKALLNNEVKLSGEEARTLLFLIEVHRTGAWTKHAIVTLAGIIIRRVSRDV